MAFENFPYTNFHEINLDWIVAKVKEAYSASNPPNYPVTSVNGQTGDVIIAIPANLVSSVNGETGDVILYRNPLTQFPSTDEQRWNLFRICDGYERGIEFDEDGAHRIEGTRRILIYDAENQPDYPVTSVNGQTGDVRISAGVNSVNGKTGNVVTPFINPNTDILKLDSNSNTVLWGISRDVAGGNVALYITSGAGSPQAFIRYTPTDGEAINLPLLTNADIPSSAGVVSVNTKTGAVTLYGSDILMGLTNPITISNAIDTEKSEREQKDSHLQNAIDQIFDSSFTEESGDPLDWSIGIIRGDNGTNYTNTLCIRTNDFIQNTYDVIAYLNDKMQFWLYAYDEDDQYIGILHNDATFSPEASLANYGLDSINLALVREKYPNYKYKLVATFSPQKAITTNDATNIGFYTARYSDVTSEIISLQNADATHNQQISALQNANITQDQRISALESNDDTQDQQITALQTADSTHNQQIAELQSADDTHSQQITDLYNASVTQSNQINELYTRTGIYAIFIENVNSLPLRYPATGTDAKIKSTNSVVSMDLYVSGVQVDDWTITTYDGYLEITGTMNGVSSMTLYLA